ncbi:solute carrier family 2, facilitated glucose transporter member 1-like isoform X2 [Bacillus rossius redtenbacheri]|uniref:solute carrier family 2, facilitated glucose transporter member 1-like isoform X2 n=1 Tax=Bacillus rossius redtenbacheri TaxID=93214 RepID=UPI002FDCA95F
MPKSSTSFYTSNMSIASELGLDRAKDFVKGSLKALNIGGSTEHRITPECELPILKSSGSELSFSQEKERIEGWTPLLVLTGVATTVGCSVPVGYSIGVMNTPAAIIKEFCNETVFSNYGSYLSEPQMNVLWSVIVSIFLMGGVTGSLTGGWVADRFGRQGAVVISGVLSLVAALFFVTCHLARSVEMLLLARLVIGLSCGLTTSTIPMYLTEIAPLSIRGAMGVLCPLGLTVGVIVAQVLGLKQVLGRPDTWPYLLGLYAVLILVSALALPFLPESPKYLYIVRGQEERGIRELTRLRGLAPDQLRDELEDMRQANKAEEEAGGSWTFGSVLRAPSLRLPLLLVCALQAGQQFSGINAVFYYSMTIFENAGLSHDGAQYASIGAGGMNLLVAIIAIPLVNRCGRRPLALWSCFTASVCLVLLCVCITYIKAFTWMPYVAIFAVLAYVFCYGYGLGPIPYFIGSELFQVAPRPVAMSYGSMANWAGNFIVGMTFPSLQALIGQYSFLLFAATTLLLTVFLKYYLPETKGRNPSDVAEILQYGFRSRINAPPLSAVRQRHCSINSAASRPHRNSETVSLSTDPPLPADSLSLSSPHSGVLVQNNSYTNLPAIPELPKSPLALRPAMPSIPENLSGLASSTRQDV